MRHMNANATPESAPDAGLGAFTKEIRSRTSSRRVGKLDRFSYPFRTKREINDFNNHEPFPADATADRRRRG